MCRLTFAFVVSHVTSHRVCRTLLLANSLCRQVDFGDLCMMVTELFTRHPEVLER